MHVPMAIDANGAQWFVKHPFAFRAGVNGFMALAARGCGMFAEERKAGFVVIEFSLIPCRCLMATLAPSGLNVSGKLAFVNVAMTTLTAQVSKVKNPAFASRAAIDDDVADHTRRRQMSAGERITRSLVLGNIKFCRHKTEHVVATLAAAAVSAICKLPKVSVAVAIPAIGESHWLGEIAAAVALFTRDLLVQSQQRKTRHRMIERR